MIFNWHLIKKTLYMAPLLMFEIALFKWAFLFELKSGKKCVLAIISYSNLSKTQFLPLFNSNKKMFIWIGRFQTSKALYSLIQDFSIKFDKWNIQRARFNKHPKNKYRNDPIIHNQRPHHKGASFVIWSR